MSRSDANPPKRNKTTVPHPFDFFLSNGWDTTNAGSPCFTPRGCRIRVRLKRNDPESGAPHLDFEMWEGSRPPLRAFQELKEGAAMRLTNPNARKSHKNAQKWLFLTMFFAHIYLNSKALLLDRRLPPPPSRCPAVWGGLNPTPSAIYKTASSRKAAIRFDSCFPQACSSTFRRPAPASTAAIPKPARSHRATAHHPER